MSTARIPEIVLPDDAAHISTAIAAARKPRVAVVMATAECKVCGAAADRESSLCAQHAGALVDSAENKRLVREFLERKSFRAAELVAHAAEVAAAKGDSKPAEFILLHSKTVDPIKTGPEGAGGIVINVGVVLPGCGT